MSDRRYLLDWMYEFDKMETTWVVWEELNTGLRQVLTITNDFKKAIGAAYYHASVTECFTGEMFVTEGEDGLGIPVSYNKNVEEDTEKSYLFIIQYNEN